MGGEDFRYAYADQLDGAGYGEHAECIRDLLAERDRLREALAWWGCGEEGGYHRGDMLKAENCPGCQALALQEERPS